MKSFIAHIKKTLKSLSIVNFFLLFLAGIISSISVTMLLSPVHLYDSGIAGLSMLLGQLTPDYLSLSLFLVILNIPIFIFGYKREGMVFTIYSIFAVLVFSISSHIIESLLPDFSFAGLLGNDLFLCTIFGGLVAGTGSGLALRFGGAIDGIEVLSVIFAKKLNLSVGTFIMIFNVILYLIAGVILQSWVLPLYSIVTYAAALKTIDFIVEGLDKSKSAMIITDKHDEICAALSEEFGSGITLLDARGYYSEKEKSAIYFVVNRFQIAKMKNIIKSIDKHAFVSITDISEVMHK